jgi:hypothetical protein
MAAASARCVALGNWWLASARGTRLIVGNRLVILRADRDFQISNVPNVRGFFLQGLGFGYQFQRRSSAVSKKRQPRIAIPLVDLSTPKMEEEAHETS